MRNWPLRWKVALYSASLAVAATLGGAMTTWFVMRHAEIMAFDRRDRHDPPDLEALGIIRLLAQRGEDAYPGVAFVPASGPAYGGT